MFAVQGSIVLQAHHARHARMDARKDETTFQAWA